MKKLLVSIAIFLFCMEFSPYIVTPILTGQNFNKNRTLTSLAELDTGTQRPVYNQNYSFIEQNILHPYVGYVNNPDSYEFIGDHGIGPPDKATVATKKSQNQYNICILGGSVAADFCSYAPKLKEYLLKDEKFQNKEIDFYCMASGGYKQPQQLLLLNYMLFLGAQYDMVIMIDGYNEVVLSYFDNLKNNIYPFYPRYWKKYAKKGFNEEDIRIAYLASHYREEKRNIFHSARTSILTFSNFYVFWLDLINKRNNGKIIELSNQAVKSHSNITLESHGPTFNYINDKLFFEEMAEKWKSASLQMNAICKTMGIEFYHFIQPNQYIENSKKFSEKELSEYILNTDSGTVPYATKVGLPYIIEKGNEIKDSVNLHSLIHVFSDTKETVYRDPWCHLNSVGNEIMAKEIAQKIIE